jgi:hypothetical protein
MSCLFFIVYLQVDPDAQQSTGLITLSMKAGNNPYIL